MKIEFKFDEKYIQKHKNSLNEIENLIIQSGLYKVEFGIYVGHANEEIMNKLAFMLALKEWFVDNAEYCYFYFDENNDMKTDVLSLLKMNESSSTIIN